MKASARWRTGNIAISCGWDRSLRLSSQVTELEQNFGVNYVIQDFMNSRNTLTLHGKVGQLDTGFYQSRRIDIGAWMEHPYSSHWNLGSARLSVSAA